MSDAHPVDTFRQWLQQRIEAGETVSLTPQSGTPRPAAASLAPEGDVAPTDDASAKPAAAQLDAASNAVNSTGASAPAPAAASKDVSHEPASAATRDSADHSTDDSTDAPADDSIDDSIEKIAAEVNACTRCRLHETRTNAVPGVGPADASLVFVGEGPGADEDAKGEPFVGRAGQLLTKIIESVKLRREDVFITNIVKCRPPNNRDPKPDEVAACEPFLKRQLKALQPSVICALGRHASTTLLQKQESMARLRTGEHSYEGVRVFPTYHPAALLRNPQWKRPVWEDIQNIRRAYDEANENP